LLNSLQSSFSKNFEDEIEKESLRKLKELKELEKKAKKEIEEKN